MADHAPHYRKPAGWLYWPATVLAWILFTLILGARIRRDPAIRKLRGPLLIIGNHPSYLDPAYMAMALFPRRINFVASRIFFRTSPGKALLNKLAAVPKTQFRSDSQALKDMFRVLRSGGNLAIYPEGQRSLDGSCQTVDEAIAKLVKKADCPVLAVRTDGGYLTWPRWSKSGLRPGRLEIQTRLLFTPEQLAEHTVPEIQATILKTLQYQDYEWQARNRHAFLSLAPARGLQNLCHQCPACGRELAMESSRFNLTCRFCGNRVRLDRFGRFQRCGSETKAYWPDPNQWHRWQLAKIAEHIQQPGFCLTFPAAAEMILDDGLSKPAGHGQISLDTEFLYFTADPSEQTEPQLQLRFPIRNKAGINADYGERFELVLADQTYRFIPDEGQIVIQLVDAISALQVT